MKRTTILDLSRFKFLKGIRDNSSLIAFFVLFLLFVFCGCLFFKFNIFRTLGRIVSKYYFGSQISVDFHVCFLFSFAVSFAFLFISYLFGSSVIGVAFIPAVVALRGFLTGIFLSFIYSNYGLTSIAYNLLIFIPSTCISVLAMLTGSCSSISLSYNLGKMLFSQGKAFSKDYLKNFIMLFFALLALSVVSALINALLSSAFLKYFRMG